MNNTNIAEDSANSEFQNRFVEQADIENEIQDDGNTILYAEGWKNLLKMAETDDNRKAKGYVLEMQNAGYKPMFYATREEYERLKTSGLTDVMLSKKKITIGRPPLTPSSGDYVLVMINDVDINQITPNTRTGREEIFQGVVGITASGFPASQLDFVDPATVDIDEKDGVSYYNPTIEKRTTEAREEVQEDVQKTMGPAELNDQLKEAEEFIHDNNGEVLYSNHMLNLYKNEALDDPGAAEEMIDDLLERGYRPMIVVSKAEADQINKNGLSNRDFSNHIITIGREPYAQKKGDNVIIKINNVDAKHIVPQVKSGKEKIFQGRVDINAGSLSPEDLSILERSDDKIGELDGVIYVE